MSSEQRKAAEQQIFNLNEAFERLSRELGDLLRAPVDGISVQAAEDNVYVWDVRFTFLRTCQLGQVRLAGLATARQYRMKLLPHSLLRQPALLLITRRVPQNSTRRKSDAQP